MTPLDDEYLARFSEQVVQEIWIELGRQRITSLRELGRLAGMTHTAVIVRMNGDARTGKRVVLNVRDLAAIGHALGVEPYELLSRAQNAMHAGTDVLTLDHLAARRRQSEVADSLPAVASRGEIEDPGEHDA